MTSKAPTRKQQEFARFFLETSQKVLLDTVNFIVCTKQKCAADGETIDHALIEWMLGAAGDTVSRKLTKSLYEKCITLEQAEFLKEQLNNYYQFLIKENIEND